MLRSRAGVPGETTVRSGCVDARQVVQDVVRRAIVAMEGDGPLNGTERRLRCLVLSDDPVAADSCCTELLGVAQSKHVVEAGRFLGNLSRASIDQIA